MKYTKQQIQKTIDHWENVLLMKEDEDLEQYQEFKFPQKIIDFYKDFELVHINDDGTAFSFSFGIPMPK